MSINFRLFELAQNVDAELYGNGNIIITGVASIKTAKKGNITFLKNSRYRDQLKSCSASAVILSKSDLCFCNSDAALIAKNPYLTYIKIAQLLNNIPKLNATISSNTSIDSDVKLGKEIGIGTNVIIKSGVVISDRVRIESGCFIGSNVKIGSDTYLHPNVTIYHDIEIGKHCVIQSGSIIGSDGFGYIKDGNNWMKIPHLGRVIIGNNVEIGSCSTVDRGTLDNTLIENDVIIDNQCQIAHNVVIGEHTAIAGGVIVAGSVIIGKNCMIGGASVINGHINICDNTVITGMSMVIKSIVTPGVYSSGIPVQPNFKWRRTTLLIMRISNIYKYVKTIEKKINCSYLSCKRMELIYLFFIVILIGFILLT